jgi:hypothetical protein
MIIRLASSHFTLFLITVSILIGTAGVMTVQIEFLATNFQLEHFPIIRGHILRQRSNFGIRSV